MSCRDSLRPLLPVLLGALLLGSMGACSEPSAPGDSARPELGRLQQPMIGGLIAPHPALDHTGALVYRSGPTGALRPLCTASVIGAQTVLSAKHCVSFLPMAARLGLELLWARGPDFTQPSELYPVVSAASAPGDEPGLSGYGRDVGVAHLARPVEDVTPVTVRPFSPELLGASLVTLSYGMSSAGGLVDGLRRIGRETVFAVEGNAYAALFGDFESFVEYVTRRTVSDRNLLPELEADPTLGDLAALQQEYEASELLPEGEIITGKAPGDTQSCEIDSGGPLLRFTREGRWEVVAVVSSGLRFARPVCALGQVFASFGPGTFEFLEAERDWRN